MAIAALYRPLLDVASELGVDPAELLAPLSLTPADLTQPDARLTPDQGRALIRRARKLTGCEEIGLLMAERVRLRDFDLLGYVLRSADSLLAGLEALVRYGRLLGDSAAFGLSRMGDLLWLRLDLAGGAPFEPEGEDAAAASACRLLRELSGERVAPIEVHLTRAKPACAARYRAWFQAPVAFGAERLQLAYAVESLTQAPPQPDPRLASLLSQQAGSLLETLPENNELLDRVRLEIGRSLSAGTLSVFHVARRCGLSERTLRRRLSSAGYSFRDVVEDTRRKRALFMIRTGHEGVAQISQKLGYSDPASFARAFRRWTGVTPQGYRSAQRDESQSTS